jgi:hypothetical protein
MSSDVPAGAYVFDPLPPGVYSVTYQRAGSTPQTRLVDLSAGQQLELDDVQLEKQARITGVVMKDGVGAAGIGVVVYRFSSYPNEVLTSTTTGPGGTFEIVGLDAPETYLLEFQVPADGPVVKSTVVFLRPDETVDLAIGL